MSNSEKRIFFILAIFTMAFISPAQEQFVPQSEMILADDGSLIPASLTGNESYQSIDSVSTCDSVTSTFADGNGHRGNMFDIFAKNSVTIMNFDGHPATNTNINIYYKPGTYVGFESNAGAWTLAGSATGVIAQPKGTPTPFPIPVNVTIPAGQTYAFYITSTNASVMLFYTNGAVGSSAGDVFTSDTNINFMQGCGLEYPFASPTPYTPRIWNGRIHYCTVIAGIGELNTILQTLTAFPNPLIDNSIVKVNTFLNNGILKISDMLGKEVKIISSINASEITISKNNLAPGMYFLHVTDDNGYNGIGKLSIE